MNPAFYQTVWRWHFYAGLFVMPFILLLSVTGAIYLFKPQLDAWQESSWTSAPATPVVSANAQVDSALASLPGAMLHNYRIPDGPGAPARVHVGLADGSGMRDIYVSPDGKVLAKVDPESRISAWVATIHGSLLAGFYGGLLVELAASWAIVMIITGLYLWWPRGQGLAGVVWPRLNLGGRRFWRDLHAVTGFWVAGLALVALASGLPWTDVWATAFRTVRAEMGWVGGVQNWKGGMTAVEHAGHDHDAMLAQMADPATASTMTLQDIVAKAEAEAMPAPAIILPPHAPARHGPPNGNDWKLTSETQNRPLIRSVTYDAMTGAETGRSGFADKHPIDQVINYGIAWHEGQLLGWFNQLVGVLMALALIMLTVSGFIMWRRRKPVGLIGAPPAPAPVQLRMVWLIIVGLAIVLPMLAASLLLLFVIDRAVVLFRPKMVPA